MSKNEPPVILLDNFILNLLLISKKFWYKKESYLQLDFFC